MSGWPAPSSTSASIADSPAETIRAPVADVDAGWALQRRARKHAQAAAAVAFEAHDAVALARAQQIHQAAEAVAALVEASAARRICFTLRMYIGHLALVAFLRMSLTRPDAVGRRLRDGGRGRPVLPGLGSSAGLRPSRFRRRVLAQASVVARLSGRRLAPPRTQGSAPPSRCGPTSSGARVPNARASRRNRGTTTRRSCARRTSSRAAAACS